MSTGDNENAGNGSGEGSARESGEGSGEGSEGESRPTAEAYAAENGIGSDENSGSASETGNPGATSAGETAGEQASVVVETLGAPRRGRHKKDCACERCVARRNGNPLPPRARNSAPRSAVVSGKKATRAEAERAANLAMAYIVPMNDAALVNLMGSVPQTRFETNAQKDAMIECFEWWGVPSGKWIALLMFTGACTAPVIARGMSNQTLDEKLAIPGGETFKEMRLKWEARVAEAEEHARALKEQEERAKQNG